LRSARLMEIARILTKYLMNYFKGDFKKELRKIAKKSSPG